MFFLARQREKHKLAMYLQNKLGNETEVYLFIYLYHAWPYIDSYTSYFRKLDISLIQPRPYHGALVPAVKASVTHLIRTENLSVYKRRL